MENRGRRMLHAAIVFSVLITIAPALEILMKVGLFANDAVGTVCGKVTCSYHNNHAGNVEAGYEIDDIRAFTLDFSKGSRGAEELYSVFRNRKRQWEVEEKDAAKQYTKNFKFEKTDGSIEYTVRILTGYCDDGLAEKFSCNLKFGQGWNAAKRVIERDIGRDELSVQDMDNPDIAIEIMRVLADSLVNLRDRLDTTAAGLAESMKNNSNGAEQKLHQFKEDFSAQMRGLDVHVKIGNMRRNKPMRDSGAAIKKSLTATNTEVLAKLGDLEVNANTGVGNMATVIDRSVSELNTDLRSAVRLASTTSQTNFGQADLSIVDSINTLNKDVKSLGADTSEEIRKTKNEVDARFVAVKANAENNFDTITKGLSKTVFDIKNIFTGLLTKEETTLSQSLDHTCQKMDENVETFKHNFNDETNSMTESVKSVRKSLSGTSRIASESLVSSLNTNDADIIGTLSNVQKNLGQTLTSLQTEVTAQEKSTNDLMEGANKRVGDVVSESKSTVLTRSEDLYKVITISITDVDTGVRNGRTGLKSDLGDFNTAVDEVIPNAGEAMTQVLESLDQHLSTGIDAATQEFSTGLKSAATQQSSSGLEGGATYQPSSSLENVAPHQPSSPQENSQKDEQTLSNVKSNILNRLNTFNTKIENSLDALQISTQETLKMTNTAVRTDMGRASADLVDMQARVTEETDRLASSAGSATADAEKAMTKTIQLSRSTVASHIDELAGNSHATVSTLSSKLSNSVGDLETESLSRLDTLKDDRTVTLDNLRAESDGVSEQVARLGGEIASQRDKTTAMKSKLDGLTDTLRDPVGDNADQINLNVIGYIKTLEEEFEDADSVLAGKAKDTVALLDGVNAKIKNMTGVMETALATLHGDVTGLGRDVQGVGTNVTGFLNTNIGEIFNNVVAGTKVITGYLRPKKCERNMNYAAISNNKYVIISPNEESSIPFDILCDTYTAGGGWIVIQRRVHNSLSFYKSWENYKQGFGELESDFYLGNDRIHNLTSENEYELQVVVTWDKQDYIASYDSFSIDDEANKYTLHVGDFSGPAGDSLTYHDNKPFSTWDRDNDANRRFSCAQKYRGAWWFDSCMMSNLNGRWEDLRWYTLANKDSVASTEMKIRRKQ